MLNISVGILMLAIWLIILDIASTNCFVFLSSQLLVVFLFRNACNTTCEAIIFFFVTHPFDFGDRCEVDGVQVIKNLSLVKAVIVSFDTLACKPRVN